MGNDKERWICRENQTDGTSCKQTNDWEWVPIWRTRVRDDSAVVHEGDEEGRDDKPFIFADLIDFLLGGFNFFSS